MAIHALRGVFTGRTTQGPVRCWSHRAIVRRKLALNFPGHGEFIGNASRRALATAAMSDEQLSGLRVNQDRLMKDLHHSCQWGQGIRWGEYVDSFCRWRDIVTEYSLGSMT